MKYYPNPIYENWTQRLICVHSDFDLDDMTLSQGHDTPLESRHQLFDLLVPFKSKTQVKIL